MQLYNGKGMLINKTEAAIYLQIAIEKENLDSISQLGKMLVERDAFINYLKTAAENNHARGMLILEVYYKESLNGLPVDKDKDAKGNVNAMNYFGLLMEKANPDIDKVYYKIINIVYTINNRVKIMLTNLKNAQKLFLIKN